MREVLIVQLIFAKVGSLMKLDFCLEMSIFSVMFVVCITIYA